jgi:hypothetical protein
MPASKRALWECPKCGRQFANRNQWHGCTTLTLADCLKGKSEKVIDLFRAFEDAVRACGPVRVHPTKSRIAFIARMTFAGAKLKGDSIEVGIILPYRSASARFHKFFPYGQGGAHYLRLESAEQLDDEVRQWLREAYQVGKQEAPNNERREARDEGRVRTPRPTPPFPRLSVAAATTAKPKPRRSPRVKAGAKSRRTGKVFYLHWNKEEAEERAAPLRAAGHEVRLHWSTQTTPKWGDYLPEVFVISLDRLPSHGRSYAGWFWEAKKRQGIPIVFAGGQPDKVEVTRNLFPGAIFCSTQELPDMVRRVLAK